MLKARKSVAQGHPMNIRYKQAIYIEFKFWCSKLSAGPEMEDKRGYERSVKS